MIIVGINAYHPDASVVMLKDGEVIWAAEEERFSRIKHASGFPGEALRQCLRDTKVPLSEIRAVAISKNPKANLLHKITYVLMQRPDKSFISNRMRAFRASSKFEDDFNDAIVGQGKMNARFIHVEHHCAHAASSFFCSGFERASFLTFDGLGDFSSAMWGLGMGNRLKIMDRIYFPHSAGFLYTAATQFLGFHHFGDEYKVMGLAAYGKPIFKDDILKMVLLKSHGKFELNLKYFLHHKGNAKVRWEGGAPQQDMLFSDQWKDVFGHPREAKEPLSDRDKNLAASIQAVLEDIYFHILNHLYSTTKESRLCLAGGVALNSLANGKIKKNTPFQDIYIQPAAGDSGTAIGAASYVYHKVFKKPRKFIMKHAYCGPEYSRGEIEQVLLDKKIEYVKMSEKEIIQKTTEKLLLGDVVGWFQGKMEFGPRALGSRSILADPGSNDMKDVLNERIKKRENFRPFAPIVPKDNAAEYFEMDCEETPFMLNVFPVKADKRHLLQAITHLDGTARVQTLSKETNPLLYELLKEYGRQKGVPILINTSFNENEPIVCTPQEAIDCFLKTRMDLLVIGDFVLERK